MRQLERMSYRELVEMILKVGVAEDEADRHEADLVLEVLGERELDALEEIARAARRN